MENEENKRLFLLYTMPIKEGESSVKSATNNSLIERDQYNNSIAPVLNNISTPIGKSEAFNITNMCSLQKFKNIHGSIKILNIDAKNMTTSLLCIMNFIKDQSIDQKSINNVQSLNGFSKAA